MDYGSYQCEKLLMLSMKKIVKNNLYTGDLLEVGLWYRGAECCRASAISNGLHVHVETMLHHSIDFRLMIYCNHVILMICKVHRLVPLCEDKLQVQITLMVKGVIDFKLMKRGNAKSRENVA